DCQNRASKTESVKGVWVLFQQDIGGARDLVVQNTRLVPVRAINAQSKIRELYSDVFAIRSKIHRPLKVEVCWSALLQLQFSETQSIVGLRRPKLLLNCLSVVELRLTVLTCLVQRISPIYVIVLGSGTAERSKA